LVPTFFVVWSNVFRRHEPGIVAERLQLAAQVMGAASIPIREGGMFASRASIWPRVYFWRTTIALFLRGF